MTEALHVFAALCFVAGLKLMGRPKSARMGNAVSGLGMVAAIVGVLMGVELSWVVVIASALIGGTAGAVAATRVKMTGMPELVALFNGLGGLASAAVASAELLDVASEQIP